jgi:hypothetical protein
MQLSATLMATVALSSVTERFLTIQITSQKSPFCFFIALLAREL